jgi:hypothetical protein
MGTANGTADNDDDDDDDDGNDNDDAIAGFDGSAPPLPLPARKLNDWRFVSGLSDGGGATSVYFPYPCAVRGTATAMLSSSKL